MARIAAHAESVFKNLPAAGRIENIKKAGYDAVEFWFFGKMDVAEAAAACKANGVLVSDFVLNSPDGRINGTLVNPADRPKYLEALKKDAERAHLLDCTKLITCTGNEIPGVPRAEQKAAIIETLSQAAVIAAKEGLTLLLEPLNTTVDHAGYYLASSAEGFDIIRAVNSPNIRLLFDCYHMQIMEGHLTASITENIGLIGHFHSAGVPGRHELFNGEINYPFLLSQIDKAGYTGLFGLEYSPLLPDEESLRRTREYLLNSELGTRKDI